MSFAARTEVSPEKTRLEIETTLRRYGADQFVSGWDGGRAFVMFRAAGRMIRFTVSLPDRKHRSITHTDKGKLRAPAQAAAEYAQAERSTWRKLLLCIRAKLESVLSGIETFDEAFLAHIVLPGNVTVGEWAKDAIPDALSSGRMPSLLALGPAKEADRG